MNTLTEAQADGHAALTCRHCGVELGLGLRQSPAAKGLTSTCVECAVFASSLDEASLARDHADGYTPDPASALCPGCGSDNIAKKAGELMVCRDCGGHGPGQEFRRAAATVAEHEAMQDGGAGYAELLTQGGAR